MTQTWLLAAIRYGAYQTIRITDFFFAGSIITFLTSHSSSFLNLHRLYCFHKWKCRCVTVFVKERISLLLEERNFLFQVIPLPKGEPVKFLNGHSKDILEFLSWQVPLQSCPVYTRWEFVSASVGHNEHLMWVNLLFQHTREWIPSVYPSALGISILEI